jgi:hypothetical protein
MTTFATALESKPPTKRDFAGGNNVIEVLRAHAVEWPDPQGRPWGEVETLCGRSTDVMELQEQSNPNGWPTGRWAKLACPVCNART